MTSLILYGSNSPTETILVSHTGDPLYKITTPWSLHQFQGYVTHIFRFQTLETGDIVQEKVGKIEWHSFRHTLICLEGSEPEASGYFLRRDRPFSSSRTFTGCDGLPYKWIIVGDTLHLYQTPGSYSLMAFTCTASPPRHTTNSPKPKTHTCKRQYETRSSLEVPVLNLDQEMMDLIVISWVFMERRRREGSKKRHQVECERGVGKEIKVGQEVESSVESGIGSGVGYEVGKVYAEDDDDMVARAF